MKVLIILYFIFNTAFGFTQGVVTSELKPTVIVAPIYPTSAALKRVEGFVDLQFVVDVNGLVKDVVVIHSEPEKTFDKAAIKAVLNYKFSPQMVDNIATEQVATQRIDFKLSEEVSKTPSPLEIMAANQPTKKPFMAVYSLSIDKPEKSDFVDVMVTDTKGEINNELLTWESDKALIPNFERIQEKIIKTAQSSLIKSYGAFNQFQKICVSKTCPPVLVSQLNSRFIKERVEFRKLKVELSIDADGNVIDHEIQKKSRKINNAEALEQMISQMKFLPATKNDKPISTKITANIKAFEYTQVYGFYLWGKEHLYLLNNLDSQWVRVAVYINERGAVIEAKVIDSSEIKFENEALNAVKKYKFKKSKASYQLIKLIDFKPAPN